MDKNMKDPLNMRFNVILVLSAIDGLEKYLTVTEAQMKKVWQGYVGGGKLVP